MKYIVLLTLLLIPGVSAIQDIHEFQEGFLTVEYPEQVNQNTEAEIRIEVQLTENSIREVSLPFTGEMLNCRPQECAGTVRIPVQKSPVTVLVQVELEDGRIITNQESIDEVREFYFLEAGSENTLLLLKYLTILPEEPDSIVISQGSPYLRDLILELLKEKTDIVLNKEEYERQKALAQQNVEITKKAEFRIQETENGKKVRTYWTISLQPNDDVKKLKNVRIFEEISKEAATSTNEITNATDKFIVLEEDPLIMWEFDELETRKEISYETNKASLTGAATVVAIEEVQKVSLLQFLLPVLIIPLIVIIVLIVAKKRE